METVAYANEKRSDQRKLCCDQTLKQTKDLTIQSENSSHFARPHFPNGPSKDL